MMIYRSLIIFFALLFSFTLPTNAADLAAGEAIATAICAECHSQDGNSENETIPKLAGQHTQYLIKQINDYKSGARLDDTMSGMAYTLSTDVDIENVAAFFVSKISTTATADKSMLASGEALYLNGNSTKGIAPCKDCHGPAGKGMAGQHTAYTIKQLNAFASATRTNDITKAMQDITSKMSASEITAVANYIAQMNKGNTETVSSNDVNDSQLSSTPLTFSSTYQWSLDGYCYWHVLSGGVPDCDRYPADPVPGHEYGICLSPKVASPECPK